MLTFTLPVKGNSFDFSQAVAYHSGAFPPESVDYVQLIQPLLRATDSLARFDQMLKAMHNSEILLAPLRNQEAVISSRMEGTISTMDEILQYQAEHTDAENSTEVRSEVIETILYRRTLNAAQKQLQDGYPLSPSLVKSMHRQLLSFGRGAGKSPGQFKQDQNYIGDKGSRIIRFIPISPEQLPGGIDALFAFISTSPHPPLLRTALTHLEFEALHPFEDPDSSPPHTSTSAATSKSTRTATSTSCANPLAPAHGNHGAPSFSTPSSTRLSTISPSPSPSARSTKK